MSITLANHQSGSQARTEYGSQTNTQNSNSPVSFGSRSDESIGTTITSIHDSFFSPVSDGSWNDAMVQKVASQQRKDAKSIQSGTSLRKRVMWAAKDREEYKTAVKAISKSNDLIENLVRTRALQTLISVRAGKAGGREATYQNAHNMPARTTEFKLPALPSLPAEEGSCIKVLARLHNALIQSTKSKEREAIAVSEFGFKASLNHSLTKESLLTDFEELPFREDSQVYLFQALKSSKVNESTFLLAESLIEPSPTRNILQEPVDDLDPFVHVGDFSAAPFDTHRLYRDSSSWASITTLQGLIRSKTKPPSPAVRYRLAALLATTYLHSTGLPYTPGQLNLENFKYFDLLSEAQSFAPGEMLEDEDRLLNIYFFSGIGSARPKNSTRGVGALRGTTPKFDVATVELGLLLYQIGSWRRLESERVSSTAALERLRAAVKQRIHELRREAGLRYAETVEKCLEWRHQTAKERETALPLLYEEIVKSLKDLDNDFRLESFDVISLHSDHGQMVQANNSNVGD